MIPEHVLLTDSQSSTSESCNNPVKVLILGASGMLGHALLRVFVSRSSFDVLGTVRSSRSIQYFNNSLHSHLLPGFTTSRLHDIDELIESFQPDVLINCIGLIKQSQNCNDSALAISTNSLFPHQLHNLCKKHGSRLIHISTDCVFSGLTGNYTEMDQPDASDLYGKTKQLGEIYDTDALTIRTSIIGHELCSCKSLLEWFLSQSSTVTGYQNAIFSGLPTNELALIMRDYIIPNRELHGLYHIASDPINKYDLLSLISNVYGKAIQIIPSSSPRIDRSLCYGLFLRHTSYSPAPWPDLVQSMFNFQHV